MKIFLTGGTGFIGKNLQDLIIENDHDLLILSRKKRSSKKKLRFIKGDIDLSIKNIGIIKKFEPQIIINLAWENIPNYDKKSIHKNLNSLLLLIKKTKTENLEFAKQALVEVLDKSQLYLSYSELEDEKHKINKSDIEINKIFYQ